MVKVIVSSVFGLALLALLGMESRAAEGDAPTFTFQITGSGRIFDFDPPVELGQRAPRKLISPRTVRRYIQGDFPPSVYITTNPAGKLYLLYEGTTSWKIATNTAGTENVIPLTGLVDGKGFFMMSGTHAASGSDIILHGKVRFFRGSAVPKNLRGEVWMTSDSSAAPAYNARVRFRSLVRVP